MKEAGRDLGVEAIARVNPMEQLPALLLPNGELMTESAAILIHLADSHPASRLSPPIDDSPMRGIARAFAARGIATPRGGDWSNVQVAAVLRR